MAAKQTLIRTLQQTLCNDYELMINYYASIVSKYIETVPYVCERNRLRLLNPVHDLRILYNTL